MNNAHISRSRNSFLIVAALAVTACSEGGSSSAASQVPVAFVNPLWVTDLEIRDTLGAVKNIFSPGEGIEFVLTIRNRSNAAQTLVFPSTQSFDFVVVSSGTQDIIWRASSGDFFSDVVTELPFGPSETKTYKTIWQQTDDNGLPVSVGDYEVQGTITASGQSLTSFGCSPFQSILVAFSIL